MEMDASAQFTIGLSAGYHDSAVAVVERGKVVSAVQEERFTRRKNDPAFPSNALEWSVRQNKITEENLAAVVWYEKPITKLARVLKTISAAGPRGLPALPKAVDGWLRDKMWASYKTERRLNELGLSSEGCLLYCEHHLGHASAAFYPSPFDSAAILTFDGVGEWTTSSVGRGFGNRVELLREQSFPDSVGLLYSAFTQHCGFRVNSGESKLMGLASYGSPTYKREILDHLVEVSADGSVRLNLEYFDFVRGTSTTSARFSKLFGPQREPESDITTRACDLASSIQAVLADIVLAAARYARDETGESRLVLGGGVALNCAANGSLLREKVFDRYWVQPAPGDAGNALGAALWADHAVRGIDRRVSTISDGMAGSRLGPSIDTVVEAERFTKLGRPFEAIDDPDALAVAVAERISAGGVVGVCRGPCEFGPRALGGRSLLADPRQAGMNDRLNRMVKRRESFRPFAPAVLEHRASEWFDLSEESPYMSFVASVRKDEIPAVTHVDGTARIQTVDQDRAPWLFQVLSHFDRLNGCPVLLNTSFNLRGRPIVLTAEDAYQTFMAADIDYLVVGDLLVSRSDQPPPSDPTEAAMLD